MRSKCGFLIAASLALPTITPAVAEQRNARIAFSGGSVAADLVYTWADGILRFHGRDYDFSVHGLGIADRDVANVVGTGEVFNLRRIKDFAGTYTAASIDGAATAGRGVVAIENQQGVRIYLRAATRGENLDLSAGRIEIDLQEQPQVAARAAGPLGVRAP